MELPTPYSLAGSQSFDSESKEGDDCNLSSDFACFEIFAEKKCRGLFSTALRTITRRNNWKARRFILYSLKLECYDKDRFCFDFHLGPSCVIRKHVVSNDMFYCTITGAHSATLELRFSLEIDCDAFIDNVNARKYLCDNKIMGVNKKKYFASPSPALIEPTQSKLLTPILQVIQEDLPEKMRFQIHKANLSVAEIVSYTFPHCDTNIDLATYALMCNASKCFLELAIYFAPFKIDAFTVIYYSGPDCFDIYLQHGGLSSCKERATGAVIKLIASYKADRMQDYLCIMKKHKFVIEDTMLEAIMMDLNNSSDPLT